MVVIHLRKGMMLGKGRGYKNIIGRDPFVHSQSAQGIKQPQRMPYFAVNPTLAKYSNAKLQEGTVKEHIEHPKFSMEQARQIAKDHLKENPRAYGKFNLEDAKATLLMAFTKYKRTPNFDKLPLAEQQKLLDAENKINQATNKKEVVDILKKTGFYVGVGTTSLLLASFAKDPETLGVLCGIGAFTAGIGAGECQATIRKYAPSLEKSKEYVDKNFPDLSKVEKENVAVRLAKYETLKGGKAYNLKINAQIDKKKYKGDVKLKLPDNGVFGGKTLSQMQQNRLADAFYNEDWVAFKKIIGKKPENHLQAEQMLENYKKGGKMSAKDYEAFAKIMGTSKDKDELKGRIFEFMAQDNPKLDRGKFYKAEKKWQESADK